MPHNRPRDRDLAKQLVRELRREADLPVVFLGIGGQAGVTIDEGVGLRRDGVRGVNVVPGEGLGGRVLRDRRPAVVADYGASRTITDSYLDEVRSEGLGPVMAVPVLSGIGETRMLLYGAHRERFEFGDRIRSVAMRLATKAGTELRIRDEVDRRIAMAQRSTAGIREAGEGPGSSDLERLRELHADLRAIAATTADADARDRLLAASGGLAAMLFPDAGGDGARSGDVGGAESGESRGGPHPDAPTLTARELDVLSQVALGCTNAEAAARLSLSTETVKAYLRNTSAKLGVKGRHAAVSRARVLGLIP
ncbi:LuxR C-terminal-related transcriptional regulator [Corynebacterium freneyi]|uniref:LuxR C-terminal-related transcriptional regulator n=1 Tax=Corynebacterium freneyi TaxID=134034 RepID=UPI00396C996E